MVQRRQHVMLHTPTQLQDLASWSFFYGFCGGTSRACMEVSQSDVGAKTVPSGLGERGHNDGGVRENSAHLGTARFRQPKVSRRRASHEQ